MKKIIIVIMMMLVSSVAALADVSTRSPVTCSGSASPWTNCGNAFLDNANQSTASVSATVNRTSQWRDYGFTIPSSASINQVIVRSDSWGSTSNHRLNIKVSTDGGATWGPNHVISNTTAQKSYFINVTSDFAWTPQKLNNTNLRVNVTCFRLSGSPTCRLDWIPVNVTYTTFDFSVSASPSNQGVAQGTNATTTVSVTKLQGGTGTVSLSTSGCPTGATCNFVPSSGNPSYNSTLTVATTPSTPAGGYVITIIGTGEGLTRNVTFNLTVTDQLASASASANPTSGTSPLNVSFTGNGTGDAPLSYFWNFGDGTNSSSQNPSHTYTSTGTYNATLTVTDFDGDFAVDSELINVDAALADLIVESITFSPASPDSDDLVTANFTVKNIGTASSGSSVLNVTLDGALRTRLGIGSLNPGGFTHVTVSDVLSAGNHTYGGYADADYTVAESNEFNNQNSNTVTVTQALNFAMSASPSSASVPAIWPFTSTNVTVSLINGTGTVSLSVSNCPTNATCTLTAGSGTPTFLSTLLINGTGCSLNCNPLPTGTHLITISGTSGSNAVNTTFNLTVF